MKEVTREQIIEMREMEMTWTAIGAQYGVTREVARLRARKTGVPAEYFKSRRGSGDREELRDLLEQGYTDEGIARHFGISYDNAKKRRLRERVLRAPSNPNSKPKTPEQLAHLKALLDDGLSFHAVRQMTGVNSATLTRHFPGRQYTPEQTLEAMRLAQQARRLYEKLEKAA